MSTLCSMLFCSESFNQFMATSFTSILRRAKLSFNFLCKLFVSTCIGVPCICTNARLSYEPSFIAEVSETSFVPDCCPDLKQVSAVYRQAFIENPFADDVPLLVSDVTVIRNGKGYTLLDNAGYSIPVEMEEETYIDALAITGGNPFSAFLVANGDLWEMKSIWYNTVYYTWRDEHN